MGKRLFLSYNVLESKESLDRLSMMEMSRGQIQRQVVIAERDAQRAKRQKDALLLLPLRGSSGGTKDVETRRKGTVERKRRARRERGRGEKSRRWRLKVAVGYWQRDGEEERESVKGAGGRRRRIDDDEGEGIRGRGRSIRRYRDHRTVAPTLSASQCPRP